jgi:hypothetical protein
MSHHATHRGKLQYIFLVGLILSLAGVLLAQNTTEKILVVNGKPTSAVMQIGGHSYIDIETVAQLTKGTFTVEPKRIVLTIPEPGSGPAPAAISSAAPAPVSGALSREFARTAIAELAEIREWRGAIGTILTYGVPIVGTWPQDYHDRVETNLAQVAVTASTVGDQEAFQLLQNEFANMTQWAGDVVATRQSLNATKTVNPNVMQNDPMLTRISDCSRFLSSMLVSGVFSDSPSCH